MMTYDQCEKQCERVGMAIPISKETNKIAIGTGCGIDGLEQFINPYGSFSILSYNPSGRIIPHFNSDLVYQIYSEDLTTVSRFKDRSQGNWTIFESIEDTPYK